MPLVRILFRNMWRDYWNTPFHTTRLMDQFFGSGPTADNLLAALTSASPRCPALQVNPQADYRRLWRSNSLASHQDFGSTVNIGGDKFQINLDVQQFSPNEISVKATDDSILVEGKHEEKQEDHGYISRHFVRRYMLPSGHDPDAIVSSLSSDGILTITAPMKNLPEPEAGKTILITQTGQPMKKTAEKLEDKPTDETSDNGK